ncbi:transmembrane domain-containing protein, putative, partial [Eimeria necatrix]
VWVGFFLGLSALIVKPGDNALFISLSILGGLGMGGYFATPEAMKPDVVDYDEFRTGARHEARFAGVFMFFANICAGIALEIMLLLLDNFGYDGSKQIGEAEPQKVVLLLRVGFGSTLLLLLLLIIPAMVCYPITRQKHADILAAIQKRLEGQHAADPLYGGPPLPPYENVSLFRQVQTSEINESQSSSFLQQVGMEVGSLAGIHGDRTGIRNI